MAGWDRPPLPVRWSAGVRPAFVGRGRELATVAATWPLVSQGARQVVFIGGEPGVGKSRIVAEAAGELHRRGATVLLGTCMPAVGAPYQPFVEPVGALITAVETGQLGATDGSWQRQLESLKIIAGAENTVPQTSVEHQFTRQLFQGCTESFLAAARARPLVLVLEDLHWAGDTALQLLRFLVANSADARTLLLGTLRTTAPDRSAALVSTVAQLYQLDGVHRIDLAGLSTEEITDYLSQVAGVSSRAARGPAAALRDQTAGNPFLLREVWRELSTRGGLGALREIDLRAPDSVLDNVSHRLAGLPPAHRRTVELAAVIGEEFPVALLIAVNRAAGTAPTMTAPQQTSPGTSPPDPTAVTYAGLEAATAVGLLEPARDMDGVFRFPHGLARQAVLDLLTEFQRATDNGCVATVLEAEFPAADRWVQRLAHHYANAQTLGYAGKAVYYLAAAAESAELGLAHLEAARLFERAAAISGGPAERDELRLKAARGYLRSSQFHRARELNLLVAGTSRGTARLRAAIGFEAASWRSGQPGEQCVDLLSSALDDVTIDEANPTHIRGIAALGRAQTFTGDHEQSRINCTRAISLARATGDVGMVATTLQISLQTASPPDQLNEKLSTAMELTSLAEQIHDIRHLGPAAYHRAAICYIQGDPVGLAAAHTDLARAARATGQPFWEWVESCFVFGRMFLRCDFAAAMQTTAAARELGRTFEPNNETEGPFGLQTFMVRRETGGLEQVRPLVSGQEDPANHWAPGLLALYCELGLPEPARRVTDFLLEGEMTRHYGSATWPVVLSFLCDAVVWLDDSVGAARLYPLAKEYAGRNLLGAEFLAMVGSGDRQLGSLESVLQLPTAADRFRSALEMDTRMGSPLHVATTLAADAAHLRRVGQEPGRLNEVTRRALGLCDRYGLARVRRLLTDVPDAQRPRTAPGRQKVSSARERKLPAGLTAREAEVLSLLGSGCSNRGIADRLFISENTAANHVRSILMKTGAANRTQAAMYAATHGLLADRSESRSARDGMQ
jgi:DNA-binding CsgD family transcriptional regulator